MTTPTEDWTLYPDNVVIFKNSTIRPRKAQKVCLKSHAEEGAFDIATKKPLMPPKPPGSNPETHARESRAYKDNTASKQTSHDWKLRPTVEKSELPAAKPQMTQMVTSRPHRLPTPDISDVDEDDFWAFDVWTNATVIIPYELERLEKMRSGHQRAPRVHTSLETGHGDFATVASVHPEAAAQLKL
ncbi:MAG: hypothetical protein L6R37_005379 [Teloschistes peruensis]|nr:MAG: hypothetical protein L6R37_005379 [Teloschistes peruensis]